MPRRKDPTLSLEAVIAAAVREAFAQQGRPVRRQRPRAQRPARNAETGGARIRPAQAPAAAATARALPTHENGGAPADTARSEARSSTELIDRVRNELAAAYDGRPVSPSRLAYRLQTEVELVDATLTYLVTRKQAKVLWSRGKSGYVPLRTN